MNSVAIGRPNLSFEFLSDSINFRPDSVVVSAVSSLASMASVWEREQHD